MLLCVLGFWPWPYIKMIFPLLLASFLPIRTLILPRIIESKYLQVGFSAFPGWYLDYLHQVLDGVHPWHPQAPLGVSSLQVFPPSCWHFYLYSYMRRAVCRFFTFSIEFNQNCIRSKSKQQFDDETSSLQVFPPCPSFSKGIVRPVKRAIGSKVIFAHLILKKIARNGGWLMK